MRHFTTEEFQKNPEAIIAMAKDGSGPIVIENKDKKQNVILMSWDEYLKMQEAVYGAEARDALDSAIKRSADSQSNARSEDLSANGEDELLKEEYDILNLNPRKNPYARKIKEEDSSLSDYNFALSSDEPDAILEDSLLEKPFDFSKAVKNPYVKDP